MSICNDSFVVLSHFHNLYLYLYPNGETCGWKVGYLYLNLNNNNNHHDEINSANAGFDTVHHHYDWLYLNQTHLLNWHTDDDDHCLSVFLFLVVGCDCNATDDCKIPCPSLFPVDTNHGHHNVLHFFLWIPITAIIMLTHITCPLIPIPMLTVVGCTHTTISMYFISF